jgi:hypothetical protein
MFSQQCTCCLLSSLIVASTRSMNDSPSNTLEHHRHFHLPMFHSNTLMTTYLINLYAKYNNTRLTCQFPYCCYVFLFYLTILVRMLFTPIVVHPAPFIRIWRCMEPSASVITRWVQFFRLDNESLDSDLKATYVLIHHCLRRIRTKLKLGLSNITRPFQQGAQEHVRLSLQFWH